MAQPTRPAVSFEAGMNPEQIQALRHTDGPCVVLAQAGCHRRGQGILMFSGEVRPVESIRGGDLLMGPDGRPREAVFIFRGRGKMCRIRPVKGDPWVVNEEHILTVVHTISGEIVDISVKDFCARSLFWRKDQKLFRVGVDAFGDGPRFVGPIAPYMLGLLLGDGCLVNTVSVSTGDPEIAEYVHDFALANEMMVRVTPDGGNSESYRLSTGSGLGLPRDRNHIIIGLREMGLYGCDSGAKFIPWNYLRADRCHRLELLAGLIDTDGSVANAGCDYISKSKRLADDVAFLARSLGLAAYVRACEKRDQNGNGGTYHRVSISGNLAEVPCLVPRKQAAVRLQKKDVLRTGFVVEPLPEEEEYFGFELTGDGRYLLDDFTVTHNSGKTRVLVHRIARLVSEGVAPTRILAVTFSKKAADEMNERLVHLGVTEARVGTWHSLCLQILRSEDSRWAKWAIDEKDAAKRIIKEIIGYRGLDWKDADLGQIRSFIGFCKANLWDCDSREARDLAATTFVGQDDKARRLGDLACETFRQSQAVLEQRGLLTFDDFLVYAHRHLQHEDVRRQWAGRWQYVLQDEAQDSNGAQNALAELLARDHRNYMIVGDPAQSIYGFRGCAPSHLLGFKEKWCAAEVVMNRNYRSVTRVVETANDVIRHGKARLDTDMRAERPERGAVTVVEAADFDDESRHFAAWVGRYRKMGKPLSQITCLFRLNAQSRALEEQLLARRIPYIIIGGVSFYDRKEVKDLLAYLRLAAGQDTEGDALRRCINAPFRYLGAAFVERLTDVYDGPVGALRSALVRVVEGGGIQSRQRQSALTWCALIEGVATAIAQKEKPGAILDRLVRSTGYIEWLEKEEGEESIEAAPAGNVRELIRVADRFATVGELLAYIEENQAAAKRQRAGDANIDRVTLMSIHRSKGLEWPYVWVVGVNDKVLPHIKGDVEEERRLMYVAMTRARDGLVLSHVTSMATRVGVRPASPSQFLYEAGLLAAEAPPVPSPLGAERSAESGPPRAAVGA